MINNNISIQLNKTNLENLKSEGIVVGVFEGEKLEHPDLIVLDKLFDCSLSTLIERNEVKGQAKEFHILHNLKGSICKMIVLGLGKRKNFTKDSIRNFVAKGARTARKISQKEVTILLSTFEEEAETLGVIAAESLVMGLDRFEVFKSKKKSDRDILETVTFLSDLDQDKLKYGINKGTILGEGNILARDIANYPGNYMTPTILAQRAKEVAEHVGMDCLIMDEPELIEKGFAGITAVSQGSDENCKMVKLSYRGNPDSDVIDLGIVGKGLTFDAGGISIKPAASMHLMKFDMCGGAGVIGSAYIIGKLKPKVNVNIYIPTSENLLGAKAYKPGDVLKMYNGVTVEILNTDAEGRLILADAICLAVEDGVKKIVNTATLTGAVLGALGHVRTGLFCKNDELTDLVKEASDECDEKVWQLPLDDEYKVILGSTCADISNSGTRMAGASTAAIFLHEFCGDVPFCHLDIAGTAWVENLPTQYSFKPYLPKDGASGTVARTLGLVAEKLAHK
ncbi:MAG: leucyl aminopeptidase [Candidatus Cloacimonadota bacterium]|nr:MAG: leucyl aminopeptidase [Candidatus Cloacimonadota bacterium]